MSLPKFKVKPRKPGKTTKHKLKMYGQSVTKQSFKDDCDINLIMAKFTKTGVMDNIRDIEPEYGFASSDDFRESMEIVSKANSMFESLPSNIRNKFKNEPATFLDFVQDEKNLEEMQEMGLALRNKNEKAQPDLQPSTETPGGAKRGESASEVGKDQPTSDGEKQNQNNDSN